MKLPPVTLQSSHLESVEYDTETFELEITFKDGATFTYQRVSHETYDALIAAPSAGKYFHQHIRNRA